jgi:antitoxin component YwqK of YwqJK toxin-antitoxin module
MTTRALLWATLVAAACSGTSRDKPPGELPPGETPTAVPPIDASTAPVNQAGADPEFWKKGDAACPDGGKLAGAGSPNVYCADSSGAMHGPSARFGDKRELLELTMYSHGKRDGLTTTFDADGKKLYQATMRGNNQHGTVTRFHPNGQKAYEGTWRDGRPDGTFHAWDQSGKELGSFTMKNGTGTLMEWHENGQKAWEQPMVNGQAHGTIVHWHPNGAKLSESTYAGGKAVGKTTSWDDKGQVLVKGQYKNDEQDGEWTYYSPSGAVERVDRYSGGRQVATIDYQDGKPLGKPVNDACASDDGAADAYRKATGKELEKDHRCIQHAPHFPGLALIGSFAYDRGCAQVAVLLDCKLVKGVDPATLLGRAGWAAARGPAREKIAMDYLREVELTWAGSMTDDPDPAKTVLEKDGGVTITAWVAEPPGMQPETTRHLTEFRFAARGGLSSKVLKSETK